MYIHVCISICVLYMQECQSTRAIHFKCISICVLYMQECQSTVCNQVRGPTSLAACVYIYMCPIYAGVPEHCMIVIRSGVPLALQHVYTCVYIYVCPIYAGVPEHCMIVIRSGVPLALQHVYTCVYIYIYAGVPEHCMIVTRRTS